MGINVNLPVLSAGSSRAANVSVMLLDTEMHKGLCGLCHGLGTPDQPLPAFCIPCVFYNTLGVNGF